MLNGLTGSCKGLTGGCKGLLLKVFLTNCLITKMLATRLVLCALWKGLVSNDLGKTLCSFAIIMAPSVKMENACLYVAKFKLLTKFETKSLLSCVYLLSKSRNMEQLPNLPHMHTHFDTLMARRESSENSIINVTSTAFSKGEQSCSEMLPCLALALMSTRESLDKTK